MIRFLFLFLICPLMTNAQVSQPRFENDTLYTSSGYTIYKGRVLQLANGTSDAGYFRFVKFHTSMIRNDTYILQNSSIRVKGLRNYKTSGDNKHTIRVNGTATLKDKTTLEVDFFLTFDKAIRGEDGSPAELVVPEEFRNVAITPPVTAPSPKQVPAETKKAESQGEVKKQTEQPDIKNRLVADEIKKLFDLYKAGALTKEEYETRKKKLLEQW
ncbi:MAG TPA: SHOCT domain-containing protein [Ferruginibacter sp.]|nr:SHOCT domain-containing protein [Ferruginibacter sp.]HNK28811.1 SHOCT domain-containing protein [Ferruginibacter sp.]HNL65107.1 SHOCT domain-containing protein [Ferruginibacter sp.]HNO99480.1 SHOCT domain-containing protein [Ferruginibacter sp.]